MNQIVPCILVWLFGFYSGVAVMVLFSVNKADIKSQAMNEITYRCQRCGQTFDPEQTDDPELHFCHSCMNELRDNPNDSYFHY